MITHLFRYAQALNLGFGEIDAQISFALYIWSPLVYNGNMLNVILGSASPRRKQLLAQLTSHFEVRVSHADEACTLANPAQHAMFTAGQKAYALQVDADELLLCADTIVWCDNMFLGKPRDNVQAKQMLQRINGKTNWVYTGVCLRTQNACDFFCEQSAVYIDMTDDALDAYVASGAPLDKAGAYGIQDPLLNAKLLSGSLSNVIGLPIEALRRHLAAFGL